MGLLFSRKKIDCKKYYEKEFSFTVTDYNLLCDCLYKNIGSNTPFDHDSLLKINNVFISFQDKLTNKLINYENCNINVSYRDNSCVSISVYKINVASKTLHIVNRFDVYATGNDLTIESNIKYKTASIFIIRNSYDITSFKLTDMPKQLTHSIRRKPPPPAGPRPMKGGNKKPSKKPSKKKSKKKSKKPSKKKSKKPSKKE
jgi:hypothetical protein